MDWQQTPYNLALILSTVVSALVSAYIWRQRGSAGVVPLFVLMLGVTLWTLGYALVMASIALPDKVFWTQVQYTGIITVPTGWFIFAARYTGRLPQYRKAYLLLAVMPLATLAMVWSHPLHDLLWRHRLVDAGGFQALVVAYGPGFWLHSAYSYLLLLAGNLLLLQGLLRFPRLYRRQLVAAIAASVAPWAANAVSIFGLSPFPYLDMTSSAFTFSGLVMALGIFRFRFLDLVPVARELVLERMDDGIVVLDARHRVADINPAALRILDCAEGVGRPAAELLAALLDELPDLLDRADGAEEKEVEVELGYEAERRNYGVRLIPLHGEGGDLPGWVLVMHDITVHLQTERTLREMKEAADAASRAKSRFLSHMNHEVRTPLVGIMGYAEMLERQLFGELNEKQLEKVGRILQSGEHLLALINDALDLSQIEAGKVRFSPETFPLAPLLREVVDTVLPLAERNGDEIVVRAEGAPEEMHADRMRVSQCLINLLSNAAKFTHEGTVTLSVDGTGDGGDVAFVVEDTGIGMSAEETERIFAAFTQADSTIGRQYGGSGLGLAITQHFAQLMGGSVEVESEAGKGSRFTLRLPLTMGV